MGDLEACLVLKQRGIDCFQTSSGHLQLAKLAVSLGDAETLAEHPASMTHRYPGKASRVWLNERLIRLSVGLEDQEDIIADLGQH